VNGFGARLADMAAAGCAGLTGSSFMMADSALLDAFRFVNVMVEYNPFVILVFSFSYSHSAGGKENKGKKENQRNGERNTAFHIKPPIINQT
jgi:hypothetical protein